MQVAVTVPRLWLLPVPPKAVAPRPAISVSVAVSTTSPQLVHRRIDYQHNIALNAFVGQPPHYAERSGIAPEFASLPDAY